jgi:enoyl-CoA hydratase/isomerase-like protein
MPPGDASGGVLTDLMLLGGSGFAMVELDYGHEAKPDAPGVVWIGMDRAGRLPAVDVEAFDILLTTRRAAPAPWVFMPDFNILIGALELEPVASAVAAQVLRATLKLSFDEALTLESLAYSMLLASGSLRSWRARTPPRPRPEAVAPRVLIEDEGPALAITLNRPDRRNAVDAAMRDALYEALTFALEHPDAPRVILRGAGPAFSAGGDLDEFGRAEDVGVAHMIRTLRSPVRLVHRLGDRLTARLHGACVGAGIEMPAAAARVLARPGAHFRLPEVSMGLIPGAGGTASIPRRIGRHRACWMAISGADVDLATALAWGLVDAEDREP